jgi:hypothetical protein
MYPISYVRRLCVIDLVCNRACVRRVYWQRPTNCIRVEIHLWLQDPFLCPFGPHTSISGLLRSPIPTANAKDLALECTQVQHVQRLTDRAIQSIPEHRVGIWHQFHFALVRKSPSGQIMVPSVPLPMWCLIVTASSMWITVGCRGSAMYT